MYATLLDEGRLSWRTMYRILDENEEIQGIIRQPAAPPQVCPDRSCLAARQTATGAGISPSSWDQPNGPTTTSTTSWMFIVATPGRWMIAQHNPRLWQRELMAPTCVRQDIQPGQLRSMRHGRFDGLQTVTLSGCDQNPFPPTCLQRQSVLGVSVLRP